MLLVYKVVKITMQTLRTRVEIVITGFVSKPVRKECPFQEKKISMCLIADGHRNFYVRSATKFILFLTVWEALRRLRSEIWLIN